MRFLGSLHCTHAPSTKVVMSKVENTDVATRPPGKSTVPTARDQPSGREIRTSKFIANQSTLYYKNTLKKK